MKTKYWIMFLNSLAQPRNQALFQFYPQLLVKTKTPNFPVLCFHRRKKIKQTHYSWLNFKIKKKKTQNVQHVKKGKT